MLKYNLLIYKRFDLLLELFPPRVAVMVGQWGVPGVVIVFTTIYWIMGISKYISG